MTQLLVLLPSYGVVVSALVTLGCKGTKLTHSTTQQSSSRRPTSARSIQRPRPSSLSTLRSSSPPAAGPEAAAGCPVNREGLGLNEIRLIHRGPGGSGPGEGPAASAPGCWAAPRRPLRGGGGSAARESARAPGRAAGGADGSGTGRVWRAGIALGPWPFRWEVRALRGNGDSCERAGQRRREGPGSGAGRGPSRWSRTGLGAARAPGPGRLRLARCGRPCSAAPGAGSCGGHSGALCSAPCQRHLAGGSAAAPGVQHCPDPRQCCWS